MPLRPDVPVPAAAVSGDPVSRGAPPRPGIRSLAADERGTASLEFLTAGLLLLVPLVWLVVAMAGIQGGVLAVEGAARQAARVWVLAVDRPEPEAQEAVRRAVAFAVADAGIDVDDVAVAFDCARAGCRSPGTRIRVTVETAVPLAGAPALFDLDRMLAVPVQATAVQTVPRFSGGAP